MKLYIDPGTGSMLFTILLGLVGAVFYSVRMLVIKLRMKVSGGKHEVNLEKIPIAIFSDTSFEIVLGIPIVATASINVYTVNPEP